MDPTARGALPFDSGTGDPADCEVAYPRRRWDLMEVDPAAAAELARHLKVSPAVGQMLLNRGFDAADLDAARGFLRPQLTDLIDPARLPGCDAAAERLARALRDGERVVIYGDYDVDGITASSILWHALTTLGHPHDRLGTYVPHRIDEGYGLNADAVRSLADGGANVIVTVDCGVTACDEAVCARECGVDLIVTDHHEWTRHPDGSPCLPEAATAVVHPKLDGGSYGNDHLTGAGVALKLAWQIGRAFTGKAKVSGPMRQFLVDAVSLAALGTVADVAPLVGENRAIVKHGLDKLTQTSLHGLRSLIDAAGLDIGKIESMDVGFKIGPRLNACGRMGHAAEAVEMLTVAAPGRSKDIAAYLEKQNRQRQTTEKAVTREAIETVRDHGWDAGDRAGIVVAGEGWHAGVVGIVASRLVEEYGRPCCVLSLDGDVAAGSGRSVEGFHLAHALAECGDLLQTHGGHAMAAGLRLGAANLDAFRDRFAEVAARDLPGTDRRRSLRADAEVKLHAVTASLATEVKRLGPFGTGNPRPMLILRGLTLASARAVGREGDHLQLQLTDQLGVTVKGIAFGCGDLAARLAPGDGLDVAAVPSLNEWQGRTSVELEVRDLRLIGSS